VEAERVGSSRQHSEAISTKGGGKRVGGDHSWSRGLLGGRGGKGRGHERGQVITREVWGKGQNGKEGKVLGGGRTKKNLAVRKKWIQSYGV